MYDNCLPHISFLHIQKTFEINKQVFFCVLRVKVLFYPFRSFHKTAGSNLNHLITWNFTPAVESVQLMMANIPFRHYYESPGLINRLDIYIPADKVESFIPGKLLTQLSKHKILNLNTTAISSSFSMNDSLNSLIKELEKPKSKSLCTDFEKFIQSVTL